jgi:hypothetical protein
LADAVIVGRRRMASHHPIRVIRPHPRRSEDLIGKNGEEPAMEAARRPRQGTGWAGFAAVMIFMVGMFNVIDGIAALANDDYYAVSQLLFGDLTVWGVIWLITGSLQLIAAFLIFSGNGFGAFIGIVTAMLNATAQLVSLGAYPVWSVIILVLDGLIIYALTVYGDAFKTA